MFANCSTSWCSFCLHHHYSSSHSAWMDHLIFLSRSCNYFQRDQRTLSPDRIREKKTHNAPDALDLNSTVIGIPQQNVKFFKFPLTSTVKSHRIDGLPNNQSRTQNHLLQQYHLSLIHCYMVPVCCCSPGYII